MKLNKFQFVEMRQHYVLIEWAKPLEVPGPYGSGFAGHGLSVGKGYVIIDIKIG
jgi:hypothetical protein